MLAACRDAVAAVPVAFAPSMTTAPRVRRRYDVVLPVWWGGQPLRLVE
jgi:hypothetical protein